jgi:hypothetical protein
MIYEIALEALLRQGVGSMPKSEKRMKPISDRFSVLALIVL